MEKQLHGGDLYGRAGMLDFSANLNPLGMPEGARRALEAPAEGWESYPDPLCRDLTAALAAQEEVSAEWIQVGPGAADLLYRAALALRPRAALTLAPTFSEYEAALRASGCEVGLHPLYEKDGFALTDSFLKKLSPALDFVALCNPNNPTGRTIDPALMERILKRCRDYGITLLVDECFVPFLDHPEEHTLKKRLKEFPNLILLSAFTKLYAMAGLRLGWVCCSDRGTLDRLAACAPPWDVSAPAQAAGLAALAEGDYLARTRETVAGERAWLGERLRELGLQVIGSEANYVFFKCHSRKDLAERLEERGILIRSCANFRGLDKRFYRVAVKDHEKNKRLAAALAEVLKGA